MTSDPEIIETRRDGPLSKSVDYDLSDYDESAVIEIKVRIREDSLTLFAHLEQGFIVIDGLDVLDDKDSYLIARHVSKCLMWHFHNDMTHGIHRNMSPVRAENLHDAINIFAQQLNLNIQSIMDAMNDIYDVRSLNNQYVDCVGLIEYSNRYFEEYKADLDSLKEYKEAIKNAQLFIDKCYGGKRDTIADEIGYQSLLLSQDMKMMSRNMQLMTESVICLTWFTAIITIMGLIDEAMFSQSYHYAILAIGVAPGVVMIVYHIIAFCMKR